MKRFLFTFMAAAGVALTNAQGVYQIPNSDFEIWASDKEPGNGWNSFASAEGTFAGWATNNPQKVDGYNSGSAVRLYSVDMTLAKANGNLTTGTVNMGAWSPKDKLNHNFTNLDSEGHNLQFAGTPDAVSCMAKFKTGGSPNGRGQFILHDKYEYKDPESSNGSGYETHKIALAAIVITQTSDWTYFEAPFSYTGNIAPEGEQYMLASFTTNPTPGASADDELIIDDVKLIYYSELASLAYDGVSYFETGKTQYIIDKPYDISKVTYSSNGKGATIEYSYDEESAILTLTVKGNDWVVNNSNQHIYTVQFAKPQPEVKEFTNSLMVNAFGTYTAPTENTVQVIKEVDGSHSFALNDFNFSGLEIGDIKVEDLEVSEQDGVTTYTAVNQMTYVQGLDATLPITLTAVEKENSLTADIEIVLGEGMVVNVTFLPGFTLNDGETIVNTAVSRSNIVLNRTFAAGWSTLCLPFETSAAALGAKFAYNFVNADEMGLDFATTEVLEANKPYLVYFEQSTDTPIYMVAEVQETNPQSVKHGEYTFVGSYASSISMAGNYGVATIDGVQKIVKGGENSTLKSTRAYFVKEGVQPSLVNIYFDREPTSIDNTINSTNSTFDVYTLQGVQVLKNASSIDGLKKGIYIINGKKTVIK